ncbi:MAG TPA: lipoyl(octanoyl) transferase LipB [Candidatus Saccharimonadales bacterium]|nr:lipoyl(octanoyl) transferase LipB [Candidatus Saccharimonadales bacterium]
MDSLLTIDLGLTSWADAYALQQRIETARKAGAIGDVFLLCEHPHVITLGRNANRVNLLASEHVLRQKNVELQPTNRGGDVTYHGPGQIVGYPIVDLTQIKRDVGWYVRTLEETMIRASADFGVETFRVPGKTGIWASARSTEEKLGAVGVHISRWVTSHGFAYNVSTDLRYFDLIIPCGIADRKATSLEKLLQRNVRLAEVQPRLIQHLAELLSREPRQVTRAELLIQLAEIEAANSVEK